MRTNNIYLNRLFKFYFHLSLHHGEQSLVVSKGNSKINHTSEVLNMLPNVFKQWDINVSGNARLKSHPDLCTLTAAGHFFNLSVDELFNLFVPKYNEEFLSGYKELNEKATINDLLANMLGFIHVKQEYESDWECDREKAKSSLFKDKYYEKHYRKHSVSQLRA